MFRRQITFDKATLLILAQLAAQRSSANVGRGGARSSVVRDAVAFAETYNALFLSFVAARGTLAVDSENESPA